MKILVIEDNKKLAHSLKKGLESESFIADILFDGEAGQARIESRHEDYDVAILDIMPILMLTAKDTTEDKIIGLDCGADDYMVKPFSFDELTARIRALLRRPEITLPTELSRHGIVLNSANRKVFFNEKEIELTLKEYGLLEYFMRHPGQVLDREQILNNLWEFEKFKKKI